MFFALTSKNVPILVHNVDIILTPAAIAYLASLGFAVKGGAIVAVGTATATTATATAATAGTAGTLATLSLGIGGASVGATVAAVAAPVAIVGGSACLGYYACKGIYSYFHHKECKQRARREASEPKRTIDVDEVRRMVENQSGDSKKIPAIIKIVKTPDGGSGNKDVTNNDKPSDERSSRRPDNRPIIDKLLDGTNKEPKTRGRSRIFSKEGGREEKDRDFDKIDFVEIKDIPEKKLRVGYLPNGDKIVNRDVSRDKRPTLEYQKKESEEKIKIRYDENKEEL
ncbi:hypothetical protein K9L05_02440 [Candidatus Babeliales bacterium]|nr:hypothetical protein [Candidatus Babeliales bacterium]MCF7899484.1 hypothetical protein [Candidatus Babeliales bacterium]